MLKKTVFFIGLALFLVSCGAPAAAPETALPVTLTPPAPTIVSATPTLQAAFPVSQPAAGDSMTWLDNSRLVYIPAGEFVMGDNSANAPAHRVTLSAYWIQQTEVTNGMYAACVRAGVCRGLPDLNDAAQVTRPVVEVNWEQAQAYCSWIQGRLPTEAEWERAAQDPDGGAYPWGAEAPDCGLANFGTCLRTVSPVASFRQGGSPLGLFDMAGNAAEWIGDWYDPTFYAATAAEDPVGPAFSDVRVVRGGSYASSAAQISAYARAYERPRATRLDLGFRCVVPTPMLFPPFCQAQAFLPAPEAGQEDSSTCQPPEVEVRGSFCQQKKGYVSVDIPAGARWQLETPRFACAASNVSAEIDRLTCYGQGNVDLKVTICSPACFGEAPEGEPLCPPGYRRDAASGKCVYTLVPPGTCPDGFASLAQGEKSICVPASSALGCPVGQYLDLQLGACLPGGGQVGCLYYGLEAKDTARACYQGCQTGYTYDPSAQCCQSSGAYPDCGPGYVYDGTLGACLPGGNYAGSGCTTVTLRTGACVDCGVYPNCAPGCEADKKTQTCIMR